MSIQTFTIGQTLTAAQMSALQANDYNQTVSTKTVSYVLVAADKGTKIAMNAAGSTTITVNTSLFTAGDTLTIVNIGAGVCTVTAGTATVSSSGPLAIPQYGSGTLYFTSTGASIFFPSAGPAASSALTFITSGTFTAVSQGTVTGCFSSTYDNYKVILDGTDFAGDLYMLFGISGTITSLTNTDWNVINCASGSVGGLGSTNVTRQLIQRNATYGTINLEIVAPNLAKETKVTSVYGGTIPGTSGIVGSSGGATKNSSQFTDFTIRSDAHPSGSITFSYRVYGYSNS